MQRTASRTLPLDADNATVRRLVGRLRAGESIALTDAKGKPVALLVGLRHRKAPRRGAGMKRDDWASLARRVSQRWSDGPGAVQTLSEMRR
jgi:antitoxin (DNA-binding transcriptional repressor) of toxin-antitoxin stability system